VGEVFPDPVTPLTSSTALWEAELGWRDAWVRMGAFEADEFPADDFCQLGVQGGYCYLNASLIRLFGERAPGLSWQTMDEQFFGAQPGIPPYEQMPGDERPDLSEKIGATFGWVFGQQQLSDLSELTEQTAALTKSLRDHRPDSVSSRCSSCGTASWRWCRCTRMFGQHLFTTYMATVPVGVDQRRCHRGGPARPDHADHRRHRRGRLGRTQPRDVGPVASGTRVVGVRRRLRRVPLRVRQPRPQRVGGALGQLGDPSGAGPGGHRPHARIARERQPTRPPRGASRRARGASAELLAMVEGDPATHGQLAAAIGCSKAWLPGRERTKTNNIRVIHEMRMAMREIGRRMVELGVFDEIEDFGFVTKDEMPAFLADPRPMATTVRERRAEYMRLEQLEPPFVFVGRTRPAPTPGLDATRWPRTVSVSAMCWPACRDAPVSPRASPEWCWTPTTRSRWSRATS
jgi:hypothetical protein